MMNKQPERETQYDIIVEGHLNESWQAWFEGFTLITTPDGQTILQGIVHDQAALHGILKKISNLGLRLVALTPTATQPGHKNQSTGHHS